MAEFKFSCPACGQNITCDTAYVGSETNCPACQRSIIVPRPASAIPSYGEPVVAIKVSTLKKAALISFCVLLVAVVACIAFPHIYKVTILTGDQHFNSRQAYRPPIEITVVAKTDSTNLRLGYAADQIIFNWEMNPLQLRVDGGPANGLHKDGAGNIPAGKYVTIKWVVTTTHQSIYVNGQLRYRHDGDYSQIVRQVSVFPANGSTVTVRSLTVKPIPDSTP
ncbi:MAG TPA: hypothetical protein VNU95_16180 [Candidatus Acidoferrales bacterium]|nr:hypothetical protein [Candidatus Acidoferrales bacterium]